MGVAVPCCYSRKLTYYVQKDQLMYNTTLFSPENVTAIFPSRDLIIVPSLTNMLMSGLPLVCGLEPETLTPNIDYTTRWILPEGDMVSSSRGRFVLSESHASIDGKIVPSTVLIVTQLSYRDSGTYTCESRSTAPGASTQWASASFELQLNCEFNGGKRKHKFSAYPCILYHTKFCNHTVELLSNSSAVNATMNDSTVELHCEMRAFIRPDSSLQWEGPGGQRITSGREKYEITFSDGSLDAAANGGRVLVPSRVSTLTITNPEPSDAGTYTCSVMGAGDSVVTIDLLVDGSSGIETTDMSTVTVTDTRLTTQETSSTASPSSNRTLHVIGIVLGSITAVILILAGLLAVAMCGVIHAQNKSRKVQVSSKDTEAHQPVYDYIDLPELDNDNRRYSGLPEKARQNEIAYEVTKYDPNADIYDEIRDTREWDDTYDMIKDTLNINTTETIIDSEMSGVYEVPFGAHGISTLVTENEAIGGTTAGADAMERNIMQEDNADAMLNNDVGHMNDNMQ